MQNSGMLKKVFLPLAALAVLALALMALPLPRAHAQTSGQGKIEGQIVNVTKDAQPTSTANLTVTLLYAAAGATKPLSTTIQSDANGKFAFTNLDTISTTRYMVTTRYKEVDYSTGILNFTSPNTPTLTADMTVYEPTTDASVIQVTQTHLVADIQSPWLPILQVVAMENTSDRVYIGKEYGPHRITLSLPVLPKAVNITFDNQTIDQTTLRGEGVLSYTLPIGPGKGQILYEYAVQFTPPKYEFNMLLPYDTDKFTIFLTDVGVTMTSAQLAPAPNPMSGVQGAPSFLALAGGKFTAGTPIKVTLDKLPAPTAQPGQTAPTTASTALPVSPQTIALIVLGAAVVAALALLVFQMTRKRAEETADEMDEEDAARQDLLQDIADLDDAFEAGKISKAEHTEKRAALKAKLAEMEE